MAATKSWGCDRFFVSLMLLLLLLLILMLVIVIEAIRSSTITITCMHEKN